jgi:transcriptional regulator with GAF, ATPase, and Fis domain
MTREATTVGRERPGRTLSPAPQARLRAVHPAELAFDLGLGSAAVVLGRTRDDGAVRIDHPTVSRTHVSIVWHEDAHVAADVGSRNGSWIDGAPLRKDPRPLRDGSLLRAGDVLLVYERGDEELDPPAVSREAIPGRSLAAVALRAAIARAAPDRAPLLLVGETGVGKERAAEEVHRLSGRRGRLMRVNCAALSAQLIEAQLFGHVRGAFTGASDAQPGLFRAAHEGTLFLDEVGELALDLQPKLLRALEERHVVPLGSERGVPVDVRVVAATHRDLAAAVDAGTFRRDLYARLSLWEIHVPSLRARRVDLLGWVATFHRGFHQERAEPRFTADAAEALVLHPWPTNLRGIDRLVRRLAPPADGAPIGADAVAAALAGPAVPPASGAAPRPHVPTRVEFVAAFAELGGNVRALARHYRRDRRQIQRWIAAYRMRQD